MKLIKKITDTVDGPGVYDAGKLAKSGAAGWSWGSGGAVGTTSIEVKRSVDQVGIASGVWSRCDYDSVLTDLLGEWDNSVNFRADLDEDGTYLIFQVPFIDDINDTDRVFGAVRINGVAISSAGNACEVGRTNTVWGSLVAWVGDLSAGDYIHGYVYHDEGNAQALDALSKLYIQRIK